MPLFYWDTRDLNRWADEGNAENITKKINGGKNGLAEDRSMLCAPAVQNRLCHASTKSFSSIKQQRTERGLRAA